MYDDLIAVLESIGSEFEIIFVNDGSDDESAKTIDSLAERDRHVRAIHLLRHYGLSRITPVLLDIVIVRFFDRHFQHPIHLFGGFGIFNILFALVSFVIMFYYKFWGGTFLETPLPTLVALFFLIGAVSTMMGILAEIVMRTYYESQEKKPYLIDRIIN